MLGALFICMENGQTKALTTGKCAIVCIWLGKKENFLFSVSILHQCRGTSTSIVYVLRSLEWCLRGFCHLLPARFPRNAVVWLVLWERVETKRGGGRRDGRNKFSHEKCAHRCFVCASVWYWENWLINWKSLAAAGCKLQGNFSSTILCINL